MMKTLTRAFYISLTIPFLYEWSKDMEEWFPHADTAFTICVNVSYSIIASYLFYLINIYFPERKERINQAESIVKGIRTIYSLAYNFTHIVNNGGLVKNNKTIPMRSTIQGHMHILQKNYDKLLIGIKDIEIHKSIMQNFYLLLYKHQFNSFTKKEWNDFAKLVCSTCQEAIDDIEKINTPLARNIVSHFNETTPNKNDG